MVRVFWTWTARRHREGALLFEKAEKIAEKSSMRAAMLAQPSSWTVRWHQMHARLPTTRLRPYRAETTGSLPEFRSQAALGRLSTAEGDHAGTGWCCRLSFFLCTFFSPLLILLSLAHRQLLALHLTSNACGDDDALCRRRLLLYQILLI